MNNLDKPFNPVGLETAAFVQVAFHHCGLHVIIKGFTDGPDAPATWPAMANTLAVTIYNVRSQLAERRGQTVNRSQGQRDHDVRNLVDLLLSLIEHGPCVPAELSGDVQLAASYQVCKDFFGWRCP